MEIGKWIAEALKCLRSVVAKLWQAAKWQGENDLGASLNCKASDAGIRWCIYAAARRVFMQNLHPILSHLLSVT